MQEDLQSRLRMAAGAGHSWARDILLLRPCEIFPYLEGRTLWIIGDSMSKVSPAEMWVSVAGLNHTCTQHRPPISCDSWEHMTRAMLTPSFLGRSHVPALRTRPWTPEVSLATELVTCLWPHWCWSQDFAFAFQCFMLEYWDREDTGRWPFNQSLSPNVSDDPAVMQDLLFELSKMEPNQEHNPWVRIHCPSQNILVRPGGSAPA